MPERTRGKYYEELEVGQVYEHRPGRTVSDTDNTMWSLLSLNVQPLHCDAHFSEDTEFGERIVNSIFTLAIVTGQQVHDITLGTTVANLGFGEIEFPNPVFAGDTIYSETEVLDKRLSESRDDSGVVQFEHRGYNQDGDLICHCQRAGLMLLEEAAD